MAGRQRGPKATDGGWYLGRITDQASHAGGFLSLRAAATGKDGNAVTTTVIRAFGLSANPEG